MELFEFIRKLKWAIDNGHRDELLSTGDHCRWCPMKMVCPELSRIASQALEWDDPYNMTEEQVAESLAMAEKLEGWIREVRRYAHERLNGGGTVAGYKLVAKRALRKWRDENSLLDWAQENGIEREDLYDMKLKSPAQLDKLADVPEELYSKVSSGTTIAREDDPRPVAVSPAKLSHAVEQLKAQRLLS